MNIKLSEKNVMISLFGKKRKTKFAITERFLCCVVMVMSEVRR